ncbi:alpha/beta fold hydrolase [Myceligenerans pegani]|uniref:Alpha/beta hydrolase n=1 Tax=Myceligenerans pegani TaxID=2776917 RepID=A0ABR9N2J9_9MICO|nr:alpha/beta hydrolase [Myceligenerans sp. TRM 65318]MBE1877875.1 alpha/beta hydrolase [Myceligenerans sp. TRM 65318]MBE3020146.1 alpha/beta hydrolase [Myceligenerans sp. TRM 65318]
MTSLLTVASAVTSADGTTIAVDRTGPDDASSVLVVVDGVLAHRPPATLALARRLATPGEDMPGDDGPGAPIATVRYDRRGRGTSGFTAPYAVAREIEDLAAVLDAAGPAALLGMSTGAFLALRAAADLGERVTAVVVHQPSHDVAAAGLYAWRHLVAAVESCVAEGDPGSAVELFLDVAGMPPEYVAGMRRCPSWTDLELHAPTIAHDGRLVIEAAAASRSSDVRARGRVTLVDDDPGTLADTLRRVVGRHQALGRPVRE